MEAKQKAKELHLKYWQTCNCSIAGASTIFKDVAKQCALIAVREKESTLLSIIGNQKHLWTEHEKEVYDELQQVKEEISKL